jgi:hypothetical protein
MKRILLIAALCAASTAHAEITTSSGATAGAQSGATASPQNTQVIESTAPANTDTKIRTTPTVYAASGYGSFSQANCMVSASAGASFISFGATGQIPVDGDHCDFRLNVQQTAAIAMTINDFMKVNGEALMAMDRQRLTTRASDMLEAASDMTCLYSDRMRAVMEAHGLCSKVANLATLDHRWNQPRNYQVDYSTAQQ